MLASTGIRWFAFDFAGLFRMHRFIDRCPICPVSWIRSIKYACLEIDGDGC
jgi:hypothetical protein